MRMYLKWTLAMVVIAVFGPLAWKKLTLAPGQPFALQTKHNATVNPAHHHSRVRLKELDTEGKEFFQWWNFLVFDAKTLDHFTIAYSFKAPLNQTLRASVALAYYRKTALQFSGADWVSLDRLKLTEPFDMSIAHKDGQGELYSLKALGDGQYGIKGRLDNRAGGSIAWDLVVHRQSGYYGGLDAENRVCMLSSTLFGYHSTAQGVITLTRKDGQVSTFAIDESERFRVYAAGSWGCTFPQGNPPIEYPWTWFWLIVPDADKDNDIGMVGGTGRFQKPIDIEGGYYAASLPAHMSAAAQPQSARQHLSSRFVRLFHRSPIELLLQGSSSDGYFKSYEVEQDDWATFKDDLGSAKVPLRHTFKFASEKHSFLVDFFIQLDQYFRLPVAHEGVVFSDFRAVGAKTHLVIKETLSDGSDYTLYDNWVHTMNAVEYAYVAPLDRPLLELPTV